MNKQLLLIILLVLQSLSVFIPISSADYIIDGDKVYIDDEYVYLSAEPHTIIETGDVVFELISKQFGGEIDVAFGIDSTNMSVKNPRVWNGSAWNLLNKNIQVVNQTYLGYDRWYLLKNVNINEDVLYRLKLTVDVVFNTSGKYFFGVKRSIDPISVGYYLDPWWDGGWSYMKNIQISNKIDDYSMFINVSKTSGGDINCSGNCKDDFGDIRFVHDNTTALSYFQAYVSSGQYSHFWVNNSYNDSCIQVYYNNTGASYIGNGTDVFVYFTNATYIPDWTWNGYSHAVDNESIYISGSVAVGNAEWTPGIYSKSNETDYAFEYCSRTYHIRAITPSSSSDGNKVFGGWRSNPSNTDSIAYRTNDSAAAMILLEPFSADDYYIWQNVVHNDTKRIDYYIYNESRDSAVGSSPNVGFYETAANGNFDYFAFGDGSAAAYDTYIWIKYAFLRMYISPEPSWGAAGTQETQLDVEAPTNFNATTQSISQILLNWTMGVNATHTYIVRKADSAPTSRADGTNIYNGTGVSTLDSGLTSMTVYHYRAWSFNSSRGNWSGGTSVDNHTGPENPTSVVATIGGTYLNTTWTKGTRADNTSVVYDASAYPTSVTDGIVLVNTSGTYYNDTTYHSGFYTLFSWNEVTNLYSTGYQVQYGSLNISVYDENTSVAISGWDVFITNEEGTQTYESTNNTNPLLINLADLPIGDNTAIKINATYYDFRLYYMDLEENDQYTLNAYLSPQNISELYLLSVVDTLGNPISDATMQIQQYINETVGYENVSIRITDANGQVDVYLIPGNWNSLYKIIISKSGYETEIADYVPSDTILTKEFVMEFAGTTEPTTYIFNNIIDFDATAYVNGSIRVRYIDSSSLTTNTQFYMYSSYNITDTLVDTETRTGENTITYWVTGLNLSRLHYVDLYFNHSYTFEETQPIRIIILPINTTTTRTQLSFETAITGAIGQSPNNIGWGNLIACFTAICVLVGFSPFNAGVGIIGAGASFSIIEIMFVINNIYILAAMPIIIFIGIFYILATREPGGHL